MVVSSAKLAILISWFFSKFIPFILVSTIMKLASASELSESGRLWRTASIRVKGPDRRLFTFIVDWILL